MKRALPESSAQLHREINESLRGIEAPVGPSGHEVRRPVDDHRAVCVERGDERIGEPVGADLDLLVLRDGEVAHSVFEEPVIGNRELAIAIAGEAPEVGTGCFAAGVELLEH